MSYILEALRKSERQRRANEDPPAARLAAESPRPATRRRSVVIGLSVLANLALLLYLAIVIKPRTDPDSQAKSGGNPAKSTAELASNPRDPAQEASKQAAPVATPTGSETNIERPPTKPRAAAASPPTKAATLPRSRRETLRTPPSAAVESHGEAALPQTLPQRRAATTGNLLQRPLTMAPQRRREIEVDESASDAGFTKPKINVYAYSNRNDADRFVIISNRKYREGDRIEDGGATVKRIEEHAMTLEYQGQTYKVPRP